MQAKILQVYLTQESKTKQDVLETSLEIYKNLKSKEIRSFDSKLHVLSHDVVLETGYAQASVVFLEEGGEKSLDVGAEITNVWVKQAGEWKQLRVHQTALPIEESSSE